MSPLRRILLILGLLILLCSLALLIFANWPLERQTERQPIPPEDLTLPTPQSFVPSLPILAAEQRGACHSSLATRAARGADL